MSHSSGALIMSGWHPSLQVGVRSCSYIHWFTLGGAGCGMKCYRQGNPLCSLMVHSHSIAWFRTSNHFSKELLMIPGLNSYVS